jgi:hypothetical protein
MIAAMVSRQSGDCDAIVARWAQELRAAGHVVRGLVQQHGCEAEEGQTRLVDIETGRLYPITQPLGPGSLSCSLDAGLLADAGAVLRKIVDDGADLAIFNRFGNLEVSGEGFSAEMLALMSRGTPVLVIVPARHLDAWRLFTGGLACELPPEASALKAWFSGVTLAAYARTSLARHQ